MSDEEFRHLERKARANPDDAQTQEAYRKAWERCGRPGQDAWTITELKRFKSKKSGGRDDLACFVYTVEPSPGAHPITLRTHYVVAKDGLATAEAMVVGQLVACALDRDLDSDTLLAMVEEPGPIKQLEADVCGKKVEKTESGFVTAAGVRREFTISQHPFVEAILDIGND